MTSLGLPFRFAIAASIGTLLLIGSMLFAVDADARVRMLPVAVVAGASLPLVAWLLARTMLKPLAAALDAGRASEAARAASERDRHRLLAILESSNDFVALTGPEGTLSYLNAAGRRVCGIDYGADLSRLSLSDFFPERVVRVLVGEAVPHARAHGSWQGQTAVRDRRGEEVPVDHMVIAHRNVDGRIEFYSSLMHDISEARAAHATIRSSQARMLAIADALPMQVSFIDRDHRYRFVNSRYEAQYGRPRDAIVGLSVAELVGPAAFESYRPWLERAASGEPQVFDVESGAIHFRVKLIPHHDDDGALAGFHFIHHDVTDHKVEEKRLSQLARTDALTGLWNRSGFDAALAEAREKCESHGSAMGLFYLDIDRFKAINDAHGHGVGDALLKAFADRLARAVRTSDAVARLGGDEFVIVAESLRSADDLRAVAEKILSAMRPAFALDGLSLSITTSIGVAFAARPTDDLLERADRALYRAKKLGRDRWEQDAGPVGMAA